jgi:hypothetical protein
MYKERTDFFYIIYTMSSFIRTIVIEQSLLV